MLAWLYMFLSRGADFHMTQLMPLPLTITNNSVYKMHDAFAVVNAAIIASKMTIAAVNQACHRCR